jgi:hypothetical protein
MPLVTLSLKGSNKTHTFPISLNVKGLFQFLLQRSVKRKSFYVDKNRIVISVNSEDADSLCSGFNNNKWDYSDYDLTLIKCKVNTYQSIYAIKIRDRNVPLAIDGFNPPPPPPSTFNQTQFNSIGVTESLKRTASSPAVPPQPLNRRLPPPIPDIIQDISETMVLSNRVSVYHDLDDYIVQAEIPYHLVHDAYGNVKECYEGRVVCIGNLKVVFITDVVHYLLEAGDSNEDASSRIIVTKKISFKHYKYIKRLRYQTQLL